VQVLVAPGPRPATEQELVDFKRRVSNELLAIPGLRALGVGLCCPTTPAARCLSLFVDPCGTALDALFHRIAELARRDAQMNARELRLRVELTHPGPRCQSEDPSCVPLFLGASPNPDLDRYPIAGPRGTCSHDGECTLGGCLAGDCVSWREAARQWTCPLSETSVEPPNLPRACGCVAGACRWFEQ
jgi:hypothetical protein